jgi:hypothetical protein
VLVWLLWNIIIRSVQYQCHLLTFADKFSVSYFRYESNVNTPHMIMYLGLLISVFGMIDIIIILLLLLSFYHCHEELPAGLIRKCEILKIGKCGTFKICASN